MSDSQLGWSDSQWQMVNNAVTEAFTKASVAGAFMTCYGPLADSAEYVRNEQLRRDKELVTVEDDTTLKLFNLRLKVELSSEQVADDSLSSALLAFRRAANSLAQIEDEIVFSGFGKDARDRAQAKVKKFEGQLKNAETAHLHADQQLARAPKGTPEEEAEKKKQKVAEIKLNKAQKALENAKSRQALTDSVVAPSPTSFVGLARVHPTVETTVTELEASGVDVQKKLVSAVVQTIADLENDQHPGPFACVLGTKFFQEAYTPQVNSMVMPADRITPLLNGPLLRSGEMDDDSGIIVSLAGGDIDIVVATPPKVQFLQVTNSAKYLFRVYEKFVVRIKDPAAVRPLDLSE